MGWSSDEEQTTKKGMDASSKILLAIIACVVLIIILIMVLLLNIQQSTFNITVDGKAVTANQDILLRKIDNITYVNIEEFAKLVGYEYHQDEEYKGFTKEENKCYVQGINETATFFLNDNKVCKLPVNELTQDYQEYTIENTIKSQEEKMYAPVEGIKLAFNVVIDETDNSFTIYTLNHLVGLYDANVKKWGYTGIAEQSFENQKSLLYGYLIVNKENGLYKIIDNQNTKEIVSDKYNSIEFIENTQEFFVTNSLGKVGIINLDGTTKLEPIYESISVLDKESDLYIIQQDEKYGVVKSGDITVIYPEYDSIGINTTDFINVESKYLILDTLIPVCKDNKWGTFDKEGKEVLKLNYDGFGCNLTTVEIEGNKKAVEPVLTIEECNGIVVEKDKKYKLVDITGKELVSTLVDSIYLLEDEYYMLYNNKELNIIERLITAGLLEDKTNNENIAKDTNLVNNTTAIKDSNQITNMLTNNALNNTVKE